MMTTATAARTTVRPMTIGKSWRPIEQATLGYGMGMSLSLAQLAHTILFIAGYVDGNRDGNWLAAAGLQPQRALGGRCGAAELAEPFGEPLAILGDDKHHQRPADQDLVGDAEQAHGPQVGRRHRPGRVGDHVRGWGGLEQFAVAFALGG